MSFRSHITEAAEFLQKHITETPQILLALSGGLDKFVDGMTDCVTVSTSDIPHFPRSRAEGHQGKLVFGRYADVPVVVSLGRVHYYEGITMQQVTFPLHVLHAVGVRTLINTNAVGGINADFAPGDLMVMRDHINMMGDNPLLGVAIESDYQFPDMTDAYPESLRNMAHRVAESVGVTLKEGVYMAVTGPNYETPAEIRAFRTMGADAIGMSTVPEMIVANFLRMNALGICCIANPAADLHEGDMNHAEVLAAMQEIEPRLMQVVQGVVRRVGAEAA